MKRTESASDRKLESCSNLDFDSDKPLAQKYSIIIKSLMCFFVMILALMPVNSFTANSSGKTFDFAVTSGKNAQISSSNFRTYSVIGDITSVVNSSNFKTELGFLRTLPYLDGEPCRVNPECVGGFCCSNVCSSSSCPTGGVAAAAAAAAGAGGGGGGAALAVNDFTIDKEFIKALIKQGGTYQTKFTVQNTGTEALSFSIDYAALKELMILSNTEFILAPNEAKDIDVTIFASEEQKPDVYSANIIVKGDGIEKALPVIIEVQAKKALFDIIVKVVPEHKNILKTENVVANITLINVGDLKPIDATLHYSIRDIEGNDLAFGMETLAIYNEVSRIKELELPPNISLGTYLFYAKVSYGIESAASVDLFYVVSQKPATCSDGIQNQNEEGADCGGVCSPCKNKIIALLVKYKFYITIVILLAIIMILLVVFKRRKYAGGYEMQLDEKVNKISAFINLALSKGYSDKKVGDALLSRGFSKEIVDKAFQKSLRSKKMIDYIEKALNRGYQTSEIKKLLLQAGWPQAEVEKNVSEAVQKRLDKFGKERL